MAAINHGISPKNASYEYLVLVQPAYSEVQTVAKTFASKKGLLYTLLQHDSLAHIVFDKKTKTTGYALFEAGKVTAKTDIISVNAPCLLMTSKPTHNQLAISVCDPDLHFYEGKTDVKYDAAGKPIERSVYSMPWINNESVVSLLEIQLIGKWQAAEKTDFFEIKKFEKGITTLLVRCQHGITRSSMLKK